ncbi:transporter SEO1 [Paramyrothecium foliicola]|nr:transporter SEO1 [Paramyrothecium foliicola]
MSATESLDTWTIDAPFLNLDCLLGEGPYYDKATKSLRMVDIRKKQLLTIPLDDPSSYSAIQLDVPISVTADVDGLDPAQKILVGLKYGLAILDRAQGTYKYITELDDPKNERLRCNDGAADPNGRFWVGTMTDFGRGPFQPEGSLYYVDQNTSKKLLDDLTIPNGIGWSPDHKTMYFTHSKSRQVFAFDYSISDGAVSNQRLFYQHDGPGEPDGLRVDVKGNIWHAVYGEGRVLKLSPQGQVIGQVSLPTRNTTCPQFVGTKLFITSAEDPKGSEESRKNGGALFQVDEERKLLVKIDALIVPYAVLAYWVKYIDQSNLTGLKEDLGFHGNELVQLQTFYIVGAVTGQIPFFFLLTYVPMHWIIPFLDIAWGVFTLLQYRVNSFAELAAYRFLVGWFEAAFFPAMHYLFGSWYRGNEISRRGGIFYVGLSLGTLTAGLIQSGASARLDGVHGLAGWRWMYIICAIITIPVGILGYFVIPGSPDQPNRRVLTQHDIDVGEARLKKAGHGSHGKFKLLDLKSVFQKPQFWGIIAIDVLFWNQGIHISAGTFLLWIKSLNRYSAAKVNELGVIAPGLGIFYTLFVCFASDLVIGPAWAITMAAGWNIIGLIILTIWDVPESALWFAFSTIYAANALSSVFHGWVNTQLRASPAQRSFTLVLINAISQSSTAWTPLLVFPTIEAPRFPKGFPFTLVSAILLVIATHILHCYLKRLDPQVQSPARLAEEGRDAQDQENTTDADVNAAVEDASTEDSKGLST